MSNEPIDVLAVMDRQIQHTRQFGGSPSFQTMEQARAAIAELIELRDRVARLNPDIGEIGAGMLASLVEHARRLGGEP